MMTDQRLERPLTLRDLRTVVAEIVKALDVRTAQALALKLDPLLERVAALEQMHVAERARDGAPLH